MSRRRETALEAALSQVEVGGPGCWEWEGSRSAGYGSVRWLGRCHRTHKLLWEALNGPVPAGLELDHLCRNRACLRPSHLEPVTHQENMRRALCRTSCRNGHPYEGNREPCGTGTTCTPCRRARARHHGPRYRAEWRAKNPIQPRKRRTHCKQGHPFAGENLIVSRPAARKNEKWQCRICLTAWWDRYNERRAASHE